MERLKPKKIIGEALKIFKENAMQILVLALILILPIQLISGFVELRESRDKSVAKTSAAYTESMEKLSEISEDEEATEEAAEEASEEAVVALSAYVSAVAPYSVVTIILTILSTVFTIVLAFLALDAANGGEIKDTSDYVALGLKTLPRYILALLCSMVLIFAGLIFVFVAVFVLLAICTITPVVCYMKKTGFKAIIHCIKILFKRPGLVLYFICANAVALLVNFGLSLALSFVNVGDIGNLIIDVVACTVVTFALSFVTMVPFVAFIETAKNEKIFFESQNKDNNDDIIRE